MKMKFKSNRKAFTLVELLIVIAIIGILFVVLVSKVDFATDKANTTGVQTDFRSFQIAFETVSRENAGFNTLGWDTGDKADASLIAGYTYENADKDAGDRIRNSYDKGDMNLNGICEEGETWTGQKIYTETWTGIYTLDNPADATDMSAYLALERAINKNIDPALRISIDPENKTIYMANGYQDPWKTEYHGFYLTNAAVDGKDRGAIVMYSDGPNKIFGSEQTIANGVVTVTVKNGGINGQDDLSIITCYTYTNGYGEIGTTTVGFSNNQQMQAGGGNGGPSVAPSQPDGEPPVTNIDYEVTEGENLVYDLRDPFYKATFKSEAALNKLTGVKVDGTIIDGSNYTTQEGSTIVTLKQSYLETLSTGNHTLEMVFTDGSAATDFSITGVVCRHENCEGGYYQYYKDGTHLNCVYCFECSTSYSDVFAEDIYSCEIEVCELNSNGDGTHTYVGYCVFCEETFSSYMTEYCSGSYCDICGYCEHENVDGMSGFDSNDSYCRNRAFCEDCGEMVTDTINYHNGPSGQCEYCWATWYVCDHDNLEESDYCEYYDSDSHMTYGYCYGCDSFYETGITEPHDFDYGDCICGAEYCSHSEMYGVCNYYNAEKHQYISSCVDCGGNDMTSYERHEYDEYSWCYACNEYCGHDSYDDNGYCLYCGINVWY